MLSWVVADLATAKALLEHETVKSLVIVEALDAVIEWHERGVLPLARADGRSAQQIRTWRLFCTGGLKEGFDPGAPTRRFDAVLVDIDHSPNFLLDLQNAAFYHERNPVWTFRRGPSKDSGLAVGHFA
jgi:hypothetical protein